MMRRTPPEVRDYLGPGRMAFAGNSLAPKTSALSDFPDPARLAYAILSSRRLGQRTRTGLLLFLEGLSVREAARAVGLRSHMSLWRAAGRYGLREVNADRRRVREALHRLRRAEQLLLRPRGGPMGAISAISLCAEALERIGSARGL
jgi:hypothetical protein